MEALIMALHKVSQKKLPFLFFGAGLPQIAKLAGEAKSYAERLFDFIPIGKLNSSHARKVIIVPAKDLGVLYEPADLDEIIRQSECYPFFLQISGSSVWDVAKKSPISLKDLQKATKKALTDLDNGF